MNSKWSNRTRPAIWVVGPDAQGKQVSAVIEAVANGYIFRACRAGEEVMTELPTKTFAGALMHVEGMLDRPPLPSEARIVDLAEGPVLALECLEHTA